MQQQLITFGTPSPKQTKQKFQSGIIATITDTHILSLETMTHMLISMHDKIPQKPQGVLLLLYTKVEQSSRFSRYKIVV